MPSPFPLVKLPRAKFLSSADILWLVPPIVHMVLVVARPHAIDLVKDNGLKLDGIGQYNIFWGFVIQLSMVATFGGDGFNPAALICTTPMGAKRISKLILLIGSIYMIAFGLKTAETQGYLNRGFVKKNIVSALGSPALCGVNVKVDKKTCEMKLCGVVESLQGTCDAKKGKGCCMQPEVFVMDEMRHFFALQFIMRVFGPYMGMTVPLWAAIVQAALRLSPSSITGLVSNPQPVLFKAILTNDYKVMPYVAAATVGGGIAALIAATTVQMVASRLFATKPKATDKSARDATPAQESKKTQ